MTRDLRSLLVCRWCRSLVPSFAACLVELREQVTKSSTDRGQACLASACVWPVLCFTLARSRHLGMRYSADTAIWRSHAVSSPPGPLPVFEFFQGLPRCSLRGVPRHRFAGRRLPLENPALAVGSPRSPLYPRAPLPTRRSGKARGPLCPATEFSRGGGRGFACEALVMPALAAKSM